MPLDRANVDTDQIIPKQFLKRIERTGFGQFLFYDWRFTPDGKPNPDFVLNQPRYKGASILRGGEKFRLRIVARARAVGARRLRLPRRHRALVRRHLFQQLREEWPADGRADRIEVNKLMKRAKETEGYQLTIDLELKQVYDDKGFSARLRSTNSGGAVCSTASTTSD